MRYLPVLAALTALTLSGRAGASPRMIPQPPPKPLGVLVRDSKTIHVLQVESVGPKGVTFKTAAALKGKEVEVPFQLLTRTNNAGIEDLLRVGAPLLCFRT